MKVIGLIPARWGSTRFPGKPLVKIGNKSMIQRVYEQSSKAIEHVVVATDDERIVNEVKRFGGQVVMTSSDHRSGTDRCAEALDVYEREHKYTFDLAINIQGDEPFMQVQQILDVIKCFEDPTAQIATLIKKITSHEALFNPNNPKVVINKNMEAIYFSRSTIPYVVNSPEIEWLNKVTFFEHLGLYAYKTDILRELTRLTPSVLELAESLEQNRWIENGFKLKVAETDFENISIDTQEDLQNLINQGGF